MGFYFGYEVGVFAGERIAFYVEFDGEHFGQFVNIGVSYMAFIGAGMDGYSVGPCLYACFGGGDYTWYADVALVSQQCYLV